MDQDELHPTPPRQPPGEATRASIDVRTLVIALAVAAALMVAYVVGSGQGGGSARADAATGDTTDPADPPTMVMTGTGKVTPVPDEMTFHVSIHAKQPDVSSALARANVTATRILHRLRTEGVNPTYVKTGGLSIHPDYDYSSGRAVISGYAASESLNVAVKDLSSAGRVLGAATDAGGNAVQISGIRLGVSDPDALLAQARKAAVDEATAKAQEYADATGRDLGAVISVREVLPGSSIPAVPSATDSFLRGAADLAATSVVPIRAGRSSNSVTVAVVWTFAD
jgi:uncharacterized protein YggE